MARFFWCYYRTVHKGWTLNANTREAVLWEGDDGATKKQGRIGMRNSKFCCTTVARQRQYPSVYFPKVPPQRKRRSALALPHAATAVGSSLADADRLATVVEDDN